MRQVPPESSRYALLDHVPLGVCVLSPELVVRFWNACLESWTQIPRREILGTDLSERFAHLREPRYFQRLAAIFEGGPPTIFSSQLHRHLIHAPLPDGRLRIQHTVVTSLAAEDGGFDALLSIQDVTDLTRRLEEHRALRHEALREARERQRAEEERRRLEAKIQHVRKLESLGVLAGGIAHDFNNLLVGILGHADLALMKDSETSPRRRHLESIIESAERAAALSNQMLAFSGRGRFVTSVVDLGAMAREVVRLLAGSFAEGARVRDRLPSGPLAVEADPAQIRQLLMSLVTNASDALAEGEGTITLAGGTLECDLEDLAESYLMDELAAGTYAYVEVVDDGPGMSAETVGKIFDPFFTTKFAGRGLGLAAALGIVRGHRGTIEVDSEPGRGTRVRVLLPASAEDVPEAPADPDAATRSSRGATVLVVDDEEAVRAVATEVLSQAGFDVLTASDGDEGVEVFTRHLNRVALVLLDMTMPRLSGHEAIRELRKVREGVPVILSSGYSEQVARDQIAGQRISGFLHKPYKPATLLAKVRETLRSAE